MDLSVLPTLYALIVFVSCFRPLVRRAGPHTDAWFAGWAFLLLHYAVLLAPAKTGRLEQSIDLLALWSIALCALSFLWAAGGARSTRSSRVLVAEVSLPVLVQSGLFAFNVPSLLLRSMAALLFLLPAIHLLLVPRNRTKTLNRLAGAFALLALTTAAMTRVDPYLMAGIFLGTLFLATAYLTFANAPKLTRGGAVMTAGLVLWGLTCPLQTLGLLDPKLSSGRAILDLPRYILAAGMILLFLDEYVGQTERLALHDPLTGLPNRRLFDNRLNAAIEESRLTQTPVACLVIDVDNFKFINDTMGHPVGDGLLQALAKRLSWNLGPRDLLARTGGDEFTALLVEAADENHVRFIAGAMMAAGCVPVSIQHHAIDVRISIGIALSPKDADDGIELHKAADDAMYRAKRRGGSIVAFAGEEVPQIHAV